MKYMKASWLLLSLATIEGYAETNTDFLQNQKPGLYAAINLEYGTIFVELYYKQAPLTVTNFAGLAAGKFDGHVSKKGNYFDGITFHRVVKGFVIQGGDPTGTGSGGPGYQFPDEFNRSLRHDSEGILSMANAGPNTNGSQFFITLAPTPHLDDKHTVFGKVIEGKELLNKVVQGDTIESLEILAKGQDAGKFLQEISWESFSADLNARAQEQERKLELGKQAIIEELSGNTDFIKTPEGIFYQVIEEGKGPKISAGDTVEVHYSLVIYGTTQTVDSSFARGEPLEITVGRRSVIPGWEIMLLKLSQGEKIIAVIPPELAYGTQGVGPIPPNAFLQFTMEVVRIK